VEGVEEGGKAIEAHPPGLVGESRDPGEQGAVGAIGDGYTELGRREVDRQVRLGADASFADDRRLRRALIGEAAEDEGLSRKELSAGVVRASDRGGSLAWDGSGGEGDGRSSLLKRRSAARRELRNALAEPVA
jgi:hypothetical protein